MDILEVTWRMDGCALGTDDSHDNPIARATDCLFRLGRPFNRLNKCFFIGEDGITRWMGIFVHSAGDRILFFPGFAQPVNHVLGFDRDVRRWDQAFEIDHLSLESDRRTWHLTSPKSTEHFGRFPTLQLDSDRLHWFSMSASNQKNLRIVRQETRIFVPTPPQDFVRRADLFHRARDGAIFQFVRLNTEHTAPPEPSFLHFSVVVGPTGFRSPENEILGLPSNTPFLITVPAGAQIIAPIRTHRILLSPDIELEITVAAIPGDLKTPLLFSAPNRTQGSSTLE